MAGDSELLRRYANDRSNPAFAEFVQRHVQWIYHTGLRRTGGRHDLAQEISQYVFTAAARNAAALARRESVGGWLYLTARYAASRLLRTEARRHIYESAAHAMTADEHDEPTSAWNEIRPALEMMIDRLSEADRQALLLRFFEGRTLAEIGATLQVSEDGARKRTERALEKLRRLLATRGVTSTSSALGTLLASNASAAIAPEIQAAVTSAALAGTAVPGAATLGLLQFMSATKAVFAGTGIIAALLCVVTGGVALYETNRARAAGTTLAAVSERYDGLVQQLHALERGERTATAAAPASPAAMRPSPTPAAPDASPADRETRRADGQAFLNAFGGQARERYRERIQLEIRRNHALFFQVARLSPEKQQALIAATARQWEETIEVTPTKIVPGVVDLSNDTLRAILGDEGFQAWRDFYRRAESANQWATSMAQSAASDGDSLSPDQIAALQRLVCENSAEYRAGRRVNEHTVDWDSVLSRAQTMLTPTQWKAAEPFLLLREAMHSLEQLEATAPAGHLAPKS